MVKRAKVIEEGDKAGSRARSVAGRMSTSRGSGAGNGGGVQIIPAGARKVVQSLKEIVNYPEAEIYAALKDCNMDPNEAVNRLLFQGILLDCPKLYVYLYVRACRCLAVSSYNFVDESYLRRCIGKYLLASS